MAINLNSMVAKNATRNWTVNACGRQNDCGRHIHKFKNILQADFIKKLAPYYRRFLFTSSNNLLIDFLDRVDHLACESMSECIPHVKSLSPVNW